MSTFGLGPGGAALTVLLVWVGRQISVPYEGVMSSPNPAWAWGHLWGAGLKEWARQREAGGEKGRGNVLELGT